MGHAELFLVSANKSRRGNMRWSDDDYDVCDGAPDGPVVGRIYKLTVAPTGNWWFWAVQLFPAVGADSGTAETREAAMEAFKAQVDAAAGMGASRSSTWVTPSEQKSSVRYSQNGPTPEIVFQFVLIFLVRSPVLDEVCFANDVQVCLDLIKLIWRQTHYP